jgi:galactose mutarotase-like enzyme
MRVMKEERYEVRSEDIRIVLSNRGAIARSIAYKNIPITRSLPDEETTPGEKGALFCAPIVFGRILNRTLRFQSKDYIMPYPEDLDAEKIDPDHVYIHGIHHYYTYETEHADTNSVSFILEKSRLPKSYPFPHSARISYRMTNSNELEISVEVFDSLVPTPAMLTVHPFFLYKQPDGETIQFRGKLIKRFDYDTEGALPQPQTSPTDLEGDGPFTEWTKLDTNLDHSFISKNGISEIRWDNGPHLLMRDESTLGTPAPHYPLQIWTTGGHTRNACGIEQGGPANLFALIDHGHVPEYYLPVVQPGKSIKRTIRYTFA